MDVHIGLKREGDVGLVGMTLEMPETGTLPDVVVMDDWVFAYDDISDEGVAVYKAVTAYQFDSVCGKGLPRVGKLYRYEV